METIDARTVCSRTRWRQFFGVLLEMRLPHPQEAAGVGLGVPLGSSEGVAACSSNAGGWISEPLWQSSCWSGGGSESSRSEVWVGLNLLRLDCHTPSQGRRRSQREGIPRCYQRWSTLRWYFQITLLPNPISAGDNTIATLLPPRVPIANQPDADRRAPSQ